MKRFVVQITAVILTLCSVQATGQQLPPETHPCLLYQDAMVTTIQDRLVMEPYETWWNRVLTEAQTGLSIDFNSLNDENDKAFYAKHLAFVYAMTDELNYGQQAAAALLELGEGDWGEGQREAKAASRYIEAFDILVGAGYFDSAPDQYGPIRNNLVDEANRLEFLLNFIYNVFNNNYELRLAGALGQYALALADEADADDWLDTAYDHLLQALDHQTVTDGGYAEGPDYLEYSAECYLPFLYAYQQLTGENLFVQPLFANVHHWNVNLRLPDGYRPNFDDANLELFYGYYLYENDPSGPVHLWDWVSADRRFAQSDMRINAICVYDHNWLDTPPDWPPTQFFEAAGTAVMRANWSSESPYLLVLGEHDDVRHGGHEHPDAGNFVFYACDTLLALDSGYISWERHHAVDSAWNHNLILVNGEGPPDYPDLFPNLGGVDAYLQRFVNTDFCDFTAVETIYRETDFYREVFFADHEAAFLVDMVDGSTLNDYEWLLHGTGTFQVDANGGTFHVEGDRRLVLHQVATSPVTFFASEDSAAFQWNQAFAHPVLHGATQAENVTYLTLLQPLCPDDSEPIFSQVDNGNTQGMIRQKDNQWTVLAIPLDIQQAVELSLNDVEYTAITRNILLKQVNNNLHYAFLNDGTDLSANGQPVVEAQEAIQLALRLHDDQWDGFVQGDDAFSVDFYVDFPADSVFFQHQPHAYDQNNGIVTVNFEGAGAFSIHFSDAVSTEPEGKRVESEWLRAYPNPFQDCVTFRFFVPTVAHVSGRVYDSAGRFVSEVVDRPYQPGWHELRWDKAAQQQSVSAGLYIVRWQVGADRYQTKTVRLAHD